MRRSRRYGSAAESVDARKQRRIIRAASQLLATRRLPRYREIRFDVIAIDASLDPPQVRHFQSAFHR